MFRQLQWCPLICVVLLSSSFIGEDVVHDVELRIADVSYVPVSSGTQGGPAYRLVMRGTVKNTSQAPVNVNHLGLYLWTDHMHLRDGEGRKWRLTQLSEVSFSGERRREETRVPVDETRTIRIEMPYGLVFAHADAGNQEHVLTTQELPPRLAWAGVGTLQSETSRLLVVGSGSLRIRAEADGK